LYFIFTTLEKPVMVLSQGYEISSTALGAV